MDAHTCTCRRCGATYNPVTSLGLWPCWQHPGRLDANVWSCCGLSIRSPLTSACTPCDHVPVVDDEDDDDDDPLWTVTSRTPWSGPGRDAGRVLVSTDAAARDALDALDPRLRDAVDAAVDAAYARADYWDALSPELRAAATRAMAAQRQQQALRGSVRTWRPRVPDDDDDASGASGASGAGAPAGAGADADAAPADATVAARVAALWACGAPVTLWVVRRVAPQPASRVLRGRAAYSPVD